MYFSPTALNVNVIGLSSFFCMHEWCCLGNIVVLTTDRCIQNKNQHDAIHLWYVSKYRKVSLFGNIYIWHTACFVKQLSGSSGRDYFKTFLSCKYARYFNQVYYTTYIGKQWRIYFTVQFRYDMSTFLQFHFVSCNLRNLDFSKFCQLSTVWSYNGCF